MQMAFSSVPEEISKMFYSLDENGDGRLSGHEIICFLNKLGISLSKRELKCLGMSTSQNEDGSLSFDEFVVLYQSVMGESSKNISNKELDDELKEAFKIYDTTEDGQRPSFLTLLLPRLFYLNNSTRLFFWCLYDMADENMGMGATNSSMGDPLFLNALIDMLKNGQGKQITMMVHEAISKVTPSCVNLVGMKDPSVPSNTSTIMVEDVSRITPTNTNVPNLWERALFESPGPTSNEQVHHFQKEASEEDLKYALLHGSQGLRQHMLDRGKKLVSGHESEEAQQSNSSGSEHEEELEDHDELFVAHNDSTVIPQTREKTIFEF
ncbi:hypothetical protein SUGI_0663100 [Cryptomeria japonica]|nr:hypothetical protein SUGI_0663100 [Cryptomeria japonica]